MDYDIVHAVDLDTYLPSVFIAKLRRKKIVYDIYDFYADMIRFRLYSRVLHYVIKKTDLLLMRFADLIVIADETRVEQLPSRINRKNIVVLNNSPSANLATIPVRDIKDNSFHIFYGGAITDDRGIEKMCDAIDGLKDVTLTVMGPCSKSLMDRLTLKKSDNPNIEFVFQWVPHTVILENTLNADTTFALYDPSVPNNRYASPNKLFEAMMLGKPIIVNKDTSMEKIVASEKCGLVVDYFDINSIRSAILLLKATPDLITSLGANGKTSFNDKYNWERMKNRLIFHYSTLIS